jgi:hypothetical protein|tara:strand:- start:1812 stop:2615 length:804 start_codon:yes stop_codon:yes gene_type:complete
MKKNKLDRNIKEKFGQRELAPSVNAWERLSLQLDQQPTQKKKGWFWFAGYAASVLVLLSIGLYTFSSDPLESIPTKGIIVNKEIDTVQILNSIEEAFKIVPIQKALVKSGKLEEKNNKDKKVIAITNTNVIPTKKKHTKNKENIRAKKNVENNIVIIPIKEEFQSNTVLKQHQNSRIKVNPKDLLYAVMNDAPKEVPAVSLKNTMSSADLLKVIKIELKKSNLKVDPKVILAEVERTINDDFFQNNFLKSLKRRITNVATAVASRNN